MVPPHSVGFRPCSASWPKILRTLASVASALSILLRATMIGTKRAGLGVVDRFDGLGHDAVVARRRTETTWSVIFAPRARIDVNASWPGVSRKTTVLSLPSLPLIVTR